MAESCGKEAIINLGLCFPQVKKYLFGKAGEAVNDYFADTLLMAHHFTICKTRFKKGIKLMQELKSLCYGARFSLKDLNTNEEQAKEFCWGVNSQLHM